MSYVVLVEISSRTSVIRVALATKASRYDLILSACLCASGDSPIGRFLQENCVVSKHSDSGRAQSPLQSGECVGGGETVVPRCKYVFFVKGSDAPARARLLRCFHA